MILIVLRFSFLIFLVSGLSVNSAVQKTGSQSTREIVQSGKTIEKTQPPKLPFKLEPTHVSLKNIKIQEVKTEDGIKAWLVSNKQIPVVTFQVLFADVGSKCDEKGRRGSLKLLASMMDEGAGPYDSQEFKKFLIEHNIHLIVDDGIDNFTIGFSVPKESLDYAFEALRLILHELRLDPKELERLKQVIRLNYKQMNENEKVKATEKLDDIILPADHPYKWTYGELLHDLPSFNSGDLRSRSKNTFIQDRAIIACCGDISSEELNQYLTKLFSKLQKTLEKKPIPDIEFQHLGSTHHVDVNIPQSLIFFAHPGFKRNDPDYFALDLALDILGSGEFGSRLIQHIREEKGLVYGIGMGKIMNANAQLIFGQAATRTQTVPEVIQMIRDEWARFVDKGVTEDELTRAKQRAIGIFPLKLGTTRGIAAALLSIQYFNLGIDYLAKRTQMIESVSVEHVGELLKKRFKKGWLTFVTAGRSHKATTTTSS